MANTIQIGADTSGFVSGVNRARASMAGLGSAVQNATKPGMFAGLTSGLQGLLGGLGIMGALTAAARGFYGAMEAGGALVDLSGQTGIAVDKLMQLQMAFDQAGMSASDVQPVVAKLQKNIAEAATGNVDAANKFKQMGLAIKDLQGLSADEQLAAVGDAIGKIQNPAQRAAMAMEVFGKSGAKLLSVFSAGGLEDVQENLGNQAALMKENAGLFDRATDVLGTAGSKIQGLFVGMASAVVPQIIEVVDSLNSIDLSGIGQAFGDAISFWINYFKNFGTEGVIVYNTLKLAFMEAVNALNDSLQSAWAGAYAGLKLAFANAINFLATEMAVIFATTAAKIKALFKGQSAETAAATAEKDVRARKVTIDTESLQKELNLAKFKVATPLFDTTETEAAIERDQAKIAESTEKTAKVAREKYATPLPAPTGAGFLPKVEETKATGAVVSSLAKIGGDISGPRTNALDIQRAQLSAQQQTARNTQIMADKLKAQPATGNMVPVYQ
jgi:hypothetical protein